MAATLAQVAALEAKVAMLEAKIDEDVGATNRDMDIGWLVVCGALVFFMQAGFAMLEAGCVGKKNVINILFKNILDASIAAFCFVFVGYGFAYGETAGGFIGTTNFALVDIYNGAGGGASDGWVEWFFQWAFAGAAATIVSGSVAERTKLEAYFVYSAVISLWIYPVVVHWGWGTGWLSAWGARPDADGNARPILKGNSESNGMIDFAGSGIVHMVGGCSGLMGAVFVGPRNGRFHPETGKPNPTPGHNSALMALGTSILWFGWYGFNCGSTLVLAGAANVAGKVAVTTTISAASGCMVATILTRLIEKHFDIGVALNGILAGLVGITAGCSVVDPWMAFLIGAIAAVIYYIAHHALLRLGVDDPLDAFPIHGCCGFWGLLAVGIFCTDNNVQYAGYPNVNTACGSGEQFAVQLIGGLVIASWAVFNSGVTFAIIKYTMGIRVGADIEHEGLDVSEHGQSGYNDATIQSNQVTILKEPPKSNQVAPTAPSNNFEGVQPF
eukprot:CAMPEP_0206227008 /NCGR_PEP_ID=MMETSP0047_2-20121206/8395_1 /ASSEMBLY_ACC=CAM_ASM_000192 /TAXON_ID=195065 /ORGANISM="Chroomonas mesostigmatica_cf, Strain CCMP1168" /LENGTH=498 /DNA_ID=CAMNT_0053650133 /DNA_START=15 /DNA_END=1511 /DNA_ORIENTATION=+